MNRKSKLLLNTVTALFYQALAIVCGLILPRAILHTYGSATNGLINSVTQFLSVISMLECGVSSVVQTNLYGPLARKERDEISKIFLSSKKFFGKIAQIFSIYIAALIIVYPILVKTYFGFKYVALLILIIAISSLANYYIGISYRIVLNADQYSFIASALRCITIILNTVFSLLLINNGCSIHTVKLVASLVFLLEPICMKIFVDYKYKINYKITYIGEPIKQKWNGLAQHIAFIIAQNADPLVLTLFSTLENVSIYSVYNLILNGMRSLFSALDSGVAPIVGNMMVKKEENKLLHFFEIYECIFHLLITFVFTVTGVLILPFISIYTKGINDADYMIPAFAAIITIAVAVSILRTPYNILVLAAGHYKQTQWSSIFEALINVVISALVVFQYGLIGVAIGTLIAMSYRTCYLVWYLSHNIVNRRMCYFVKHIIVDIFCVFIMLFTMQKMVISVGSYIEWFYLAIRVGVVGLAECTIVHMIPYNKIIFKSINMLFAKRNKND